VTVLAVIATIVAGGLAATARFGISLAFARRRELPWAVLLVNVVGSAIAGAVLGLNSSGAMSGDLRLVLMGGVAGGLTTFSTFSVETMQLLRERRWVTAGVNVAANLVLGIAAASAGYLLTR